jgi:hypothetical protein
MYQLVTESYVQQVERWHTTGKNIYAQYDAESIVVYQAYNPEIGHFAAKHQYFGGEFKLSRMTWVKPNFLWMMYRSSWGTASGQEVILAIWLKRAAFDEILSQAVPSSFQSDMYPDTETWQRAVAQSDVRLQWDPDHNPAGGKVERRAIQLGLRGEAIERYAHDWILHIEDISAFVAEQRPHAKPPYTHLITPREEIYRGA